MLLVMLGGYDGCFTTDTLLTYCEVRAVVGIDEVVFDVAVSLLS